MIKLIALGKIKEAALNTLIQDYLKRIQAFTKLEIIELKDASTSDKAGTNQVAINTESNLILDKIQARDVVVLCELNGRLIDSIELSNIIDLHQTHSQDIVFVIGGSLGVDERVKQRANYQWKLSANTFPHALVRLLVLEQIYRSFKILNHQSYHK
jgi:23S rRNA (pseudouridine1915-N3)-methyltransferase